MNGVKSHRRSIRTLAAHVPVVCGIACLLAGVAASGCVSDMPADEKVTVVISGIRDKDHGEFISEMLKKFVEQDADSSGFMAESQTVNDVMTITLWPVADPQQLAGRIDFGTVTQIKGRTIQVEIPPFQN